MAARSGDDRAKVQADKHRTANWTKGLAAAVISVLTLAFTARLPDIWVWRHLVNAAHVAVGLHALVDIYFLRLFCSFWTTVADSACPDALQQANSSSAHARGRTTCLGSHGLLHCLPFLVSCVLMSLTLPMTAWSCGRITLASFQAAITVILSLRVLAATHCLLCLSIATEEHRNLHNELALTKASLAAKEAVNQHRASFLRYVFHEVRVPFNSLHLGLSALMDERASMPACFHEILDQMVSASETMGIIMNDVLDVSKIEAHALQLKMVPVDIRRLLRLVCTHMQPFVASMGVRLDLQDLGRAVGAEGGGWGTGWFLADGTRLMQIFNNFISNASKFSPHDGSGVVRVGVRLEAWMREVAGDTREEAQLHRAASSSSLSHSSSTHRQHRQHASGAGDEDDGSGDDDAVSVGLGRAGTAGSSKLRPSQRSDLGWCGDGDGDGDGRSEAAGTRRRRRWRLEYVRPGLAQDKMVTITSSATANSMTAAGIASMTQAAPSCCSSSSSSSSSSPPQANPALGDADVAARATHAGRFPCSMVPHHAAPRLCASTCDLDMILVPRDEDEVEGGGGGIDIGSGGGAGGQQVERSGSRGGSRSALGALRQQQDEAGQATGDQSLANGSSISGTIGSPIPEPRTRSMDPPQRHEVPDEVAEATAVHRTGRAALLCVTVCDDGPGIPASDMSKVFKAFSQLDAGLAYKGRGTGLGLAISREIASMHGGGIGVCSEEGKGADFFVRIPLLEVRRPSSFGGSSSGGGPWSLETGHAGTISGFNDNGDTAMTRATPETMSTIGSAEVDVDEAAVSTAAGVAAARARARMRMYSQPSSEGSSPAVSGLQTPSIDRNISSSSGTGSGTGSVMLRPRSGAGASVAPSCGSGASNGHARAGGHLEAALRAYRSDRFPGPMASAACARGASRMWVGDSGDRDDEAVNRAAGVLRRQHLPHRYEASPPASLAVPSASASAGSAIQCRPVPTMPVYTPGQSQLRIELAEDSGGGGGAAAVEGTWDAGLEVGPAPLLRLPPPLPLPTRHSTVGEMAAAGASRLCDVGAAAAPKSHGACAEADDACAGTGLAGVASARAQPLPPVAPGVVPIRVLVVDDVPSTRKLLARALMNRLSKPVAGTETPAATAASTASAVQAAGATPTPVATATVAASGGPPSPAVVSVPPSPNVPSTASGAHRELMVGRLVRASGGRTPMHVDSDHAHVGGEHVRSVQPARAHGQAPSRPTSLQEQRRRQLPDLHQRQPPPRIQLTVDEAEDGAAAVRTFTAALSSSFPATPELTGASAGGDGQQQQRRQSAGRPYDVITMDKEMPGMDGYEATRMIRDAEARHGVGSSGIGTSAAPNQLLRCHIIGVTGNALVQDQAEFMRHGVDQVLIKPVDVTAVAQAIRDRAAAIQQRHTL